MHSGYLESDSFHLYFHSTFRSFLCLWGNDGIKWWYLIFIRKEREMLKIGTHDSATGEKGVWWSLPLSPFAKTQKKTIREQYDAGCRLFDLRIKKVKKKWRMCHGWWFTKRTAESIFEELNSFESLSLLSLRSFIGVFSICISLSFSFSFLSFKISFIFKFPFSL